MNRVCEIRNKPSVTSESSVRPVMKLILASLPVVFLCCFDTIESYKNYTDTYEDYDYDTDQTNSPDGTRSELDWQTGNRSSPIYGDHQFTPSSQTTTPLPYSINKEKDQSVREWNRKNQVKTLFPSVEFFAFFYFKIFSR